MTTTIQKDGMTEFLEEKIEASGLYAVRYRDNKHVIVDEKEGEKRTAYILAHTTLETIEEIKELQEMNRQEGDVFTAHVFYEDHHNFFRRLGRESHFKSDKSLKEYSKEERDRMVELRKIEREMMKQGEVAFQGPGRLVYYHPETPIIPECLRIFRMHPVSLDYSHVGSDHPAYSFAKNRESETWKISEERAKIVDEPAYLFFHETSALNHKTPSLKQAFITKKDYDHRHTSTQTER